VRIAITEAGTERFRSYNIELSQLAAVPSERFTSDLLVNISSMKERTATTRLEPIELVCGKTRVASRKPINPTGRRHAIWTSDPPQVSRSSTAPMSDRNESSINGTE
jgi:SMC interacting uncharacterized protein involved in chromosome segregation